MDTVRAPEAIQDRLESVEAEIEELESADADEDLLYALKSTRELLRWVLRKDDPVPIGSQWRADIAVVGQVVGEFEIEPDSNVDSLLLACKITDDKIQPIGESEKPGEYALLRRLAEDKEDVDPPDID